MFCRYCGKPLPEEAAFCPECGMRRKGAVQQSMPPRQAVPEQRAKEQKPPGSPKKRKLWPLVTIGAAALVLGGGILAAVKLLPQRQAQDIASEVGYTAAPDPEAFVELDGGTKLISNELIVCFDGSASEEEIADLLSDYDGEIVGRNYLLDDYQVRFTGSGQSYIEDLYDALGNEPLVETLCYNLAFETEAEFIPNDPEYDGTFQEWDVSNPDGKNWGLELIDAPGAWDHRDELSTVKVGVLDSFLDHDHEDLGIPADHCFVLPTDDFRTYEVLENYLDNHRSHSHSILNNPAAGCNFCLDLDHGSHVSGIIAAKLDNGRGTAGVAPNAELWFGTYNYYYKGGSDYPLGNYKDASIPGGRYNSECGILYAVSRLVSSGCRVVNMSIGDYKPSEPDEYERVITDYTDRAIEQLEEQGYDFLIVKAAGNEHDDASNDRLNRILTTGTHARAHTIIVASCTDSAFDMVLDIANFSFLRDYALLPGANLASEENVYALAEHSNDGELVDVAAPGYDIMSTIDGNRYKKRAAPRWQLPWSRACVHSFTVPIRLSITGSARPVCAARTEPLPCAAAASIRSWMQT